MNTYTNSRNNTWNDFEVRRQHSHQLVHVTGAPSKLLKRYTSASNTTCDDHSILSSNTVPRKSKVLKSGLTVQGTAVSNSKSHIGCHTKPPQAEPQPVKKPMVPRKTVCLEGCRYDVVRRISLELGFREVGETEFWNILWTDTPISLEKALDIRRIQEANRICWGPFMTAQKANHFPGMSEICRKDRLARNLNRMRKVFPDEYLFFPETWTLPADVAEFLNHFRLTKGQTYICKPDTGCQGRGIFLVRNLKKINPFAKLISQVYIPNPLLIDGYKFDLRLYVLITSCDPLRIYIYNEGIARFATVKYSPPNEQNMHVVFMHLTNYSLNKFSQAYMPEPEGSKRKLSTIYGYLVERGCNVEKLMDDIDDVIVKTIVAAQPTLRHYYRASFPRYECGSACFELLGFDILIDAKLKPWLLEVNLSPSFNLDLEVDAEVKEILLRDTFNKIYLGSVRDKPPSQGPISPAKKGVVNLSSTSAQGKLDLTDKAGNSISVLTHRQFYHEQVNQGNFRLLYPTDNCLKYATFLDPNLNSCTLNDPSASASSRRAWTNYDPCDNRLPRFELKAPN